MKVLIKNQKYTIKETSIGGGEGEICTIEDYPESKLVKIYDKDKRTAYIQRKVTAFINKFRQINLGGVENFIAFPEHSVFEVDNSFSCFCGFLMKNFNNHSKMFLSGFDLNSFSYKNNAIDDRKAISIISTLYTYLEVLHNAGFILGDINPENIMLDNETLMPTIVDFDSAQLGTFYSNTKRQEYIDPTVRVDGYGRKKHFIYTTESDIYSMAIVCYKFIVGIHPYYFLTTEAHSQDYNKRNLLSFLDYFENNLKKISKYNFEVFEERASKATTDRLNYLKTKHNDIYSYFKSIFSEDLRHYFHQNNSKKYNVNAVNSEQNNFEISELIPQPKEDPEELAIFMKQYDLKVF